MKIGVLGGTSGTYAFVGEQQLSGAEIAADEVNGDGGVLGEQIHLLPVDDGGDPTKAVNALQKYEKEGVAGILGSADTTEAVVPYAERIETLLTGVLGGGAVNITPEGPGTTPMKWAFHIGTDVYIEAEIVSKFASANCSKVAMLHDTTSFGVSAEEVTKQVLDEEGGAKLVLNDPVPENWTSAAVPDVAPEVQRVKGTGADCLLGWISPQAAAAIVKEARSQGYTIQVMGSDSYSSFSEYGKLAGPAADGTISVSLAGLAEPNAMMKKFQAAFEKRENEPPSVYAICSYVALQTLAHAIEEAGTTDPSAVRDAMEEVTDFPTAIGPISFGPMQHSAITADMMVLLQFDYKTGEWGPVEK